MKPTLENTRLLGIGETIAASDYIVVPENDHAPAEFLPVEQPEVGVIISYDQQYDYRRPLFNAFDLICQEHNIETVAGQTMLRTSLEAIAKFDQDQRDF